MERPSSPKSGISEMQGPHHVAQMLIIVSFFPAKMELVTVSPSKVWEENAGKTPAASTVQHIPKIKRTAAIPVKIFFNVHTLLSKFKIFDSQVVFFELFGFKNNKAHAAKNTNFFIDIFPQSYISVKPELPIIFCGCQRGEPKPPTVKPTN
jgi:hypothetical protein